MRGISSAHAAATPIMVAADPSSKLASHGAPVRAHRVPGITTSASDLAARQSPPTYLPAPVGKAIRQGETRATGPGMPSYYLIRTWHGTSLWADLASGSI